MLGRRGTSGTEGFGIGRILVVYIGMSEAFLESGMGSSSPSGGARGIHSLKQQYKKRRRTMKDSDIPDVQRDTA